MLLGEHTLRRKLATRNTGGALEQQALPTRARAVVSRDDVDHATVRVRAVQSATLRPANDLQAFNRRRIKLLHEERVRDLDAVDVDLWDAQTKRARPANASVT